MTTISILDVLSTIGPDGRASLLLAGTLDESTAPRVEREVHALARQGASSLVIDIADVRTIDSAGFGALLAVGSLLGGRVAVRDDLGLVRPMVDRSTSTSG